MHGVYIITMYSISQCYIVMSQHITQLFDVSSCITCYVFFRAQTLLERGSLQHTTRQHRNQALIDSLLLAHHCQCEHRRARRHSLHHA
jgi:hypothetical protein